MSGTHIIGIQILVRWVINVFLERRTVTAKHLFWLHLRTSVCKTISIEIYLRIFTSLNVNIIVHVDRGTPTLVDSWNQMLIFLHSRHASDFHQLVSRWNHLLLHLWDINHLRAPKMSRRILLVTLRHFDLLSKIYRSLLHGPWAVMN
jgi:hypothetical protein